jgi:hypothetical protein
VRETTAAVVLGAVVVLGAGCGGSSVKPSGDGTTSPGPTAVPTQKLDVVLNDSGLKLSAKHIWAGVYRISFRDRRSHRQAGDRVALVFGPSGPRIALVTVPAGGESVGTLIQNDIAWVTVNGVANFSPGGDSLSVSPTPQYPTPAT